ncbi:hypothetical protein [Streptomyces sp. NBC_01433]|uniref:hypothetical protein n=1 Tax=Streptomyces sp. NBC_01433 TaxID=2903864 RepID=UPI002B1CBE9F|nr:hypothetical protein [Streptomyces sp. NBC_01433]
MTRRWALITTITVLTVALAFVVVQLVRGPDSGKELAATEQAGKEKDGKDEAGAKPAASNPTEDKSNSDDSIPAGYLGTWSGSIDNAAGRSTRQLVIQQGTVGRTVLSLTADGPLDNGGSYHCVFQAILTAEPSPSGPVEVGPSTVVVGEPMSSCTAGGPTTLTLLPDGSLSRANTDSGEQLTYTKTA